MEIAAMNAFRVIFPRYSDMIDESSVKTSQDLEHFVREQLPLKVEMVRKLQVTFVAFLNQYTNLILKRPEISNLTYGLVSRASERSDKIFKDIELEVHKLDKATLESSFSQMNMPEIREKFRSKLTDMSDLINEKFINNHGLSRQNEEQTAVKLFTLLETYHFMKSDLQTLAAKYRINQAVLLESINKKTEIPDLWSLFSLDSGFVQYISQIVNKRCRPSINKRDFFGNKIREILREKQSSVGQNFNILIDSLLSKQGYRVSKQIFSKLHLSLKGLSDKDTKFDQEQECKEIIQEVQAIKKQFNSLKNNSYYIDLMRGTFIDKYKMELNKLQNLYYLSNMEKYLQNVSEFLEKLILLEQKVIENRRQFISKLGDKIQEKIDELIDTFAQKNAQRISIQNLLDAQFQALENSLYGILQAPVSPKVSRQAMNEQYRDQKRRQAQQRRVKMEEERKERERARQQQMQRKKSQDQRKRQQERIRMQQRKAEEKQKFEIQKRERQQKDRQKRQEMRIKEQQRKRRDEEDRKKKEIQMKKKDEQKQARERLQRQKKEKEFKEMKEREERKKQQDRIRREQQKRKQQIRIDEQKKRREEKQKEELQKKKQEEEKKRRQKEAEDQKRREKQEQDRKKREQEAEQRRKKAKDQEQRQKKLKEEQDKKRKQQLEEQRLRKQKEEDQRKIREKEQQERLKKKKEEQQRARKQKQDDDRKRREQEAKKKKDEEDRKRQLQQQEDRKRKLKEEQDRKKREKQEQDRKRKLKQEEDRKKRQKQQQQRKRKQKQAEEKRAREEAEKKRLQKEAEEKRIKQEAERKRKQKQAQQKRQKEQADKKRKQKEEQDRIKKQAQDKKRKEQQAERKRKQEEDKRKKQKEEEEALFLLEEAEKNAKAKNKKPAPAKGSGINYGEFDDILDDDLDQMENAGKKTDPKKPDNDDQYVLDYEEDFDDYSPDKDQPGDEGEQDDVIETKQLIEFDNLKCLNDYLKGTQYARKNKPNLQPFNNYNQYVYLFEEFIDNGKIFIFEPGIAKAIMSNSADIAGETGESEVILEQIIQDIQVGIIQSYSKHSGSEELDPQTCYIFPFSFPNKLNILLVQVFLVFSESPPASKITVIFKEPLDSNNEEVVEEYQCLVHAFLRILGIELDPIIQDFSLKEESKMVIETFDKQLPNLLTMFAMHYEHNFQMKVNIDQYTTERFFHVSNILEPFYKLIKEEEENVSEFFDGLAQKYGQEGTEDIKNITFEIEANHPGFQQQLAEGCHSVKEMFLGTDVKTLLVLLVVMVPSGEEESGLEDEEPDSEKITLYFQMTKNKPKPSLNYYIVSKNQQHQDFISQDLVEFIFGDIDSNFETTVYTDYTRHNALSEYSDWTIALWPHIIKKRKMTPINAFRTMTLSMAPYYVSYKKMD